MQQVSPAASNELSEKPRFTKAHSTALINGNGNGVRDHSPPPRLERVTAGSIPISIIADRVIRKSYGEFLNLAETYDSRLRRVFMVDCPL
jgi:hypothetical protein